MVRFVLCLLLTFVASGNAVICYIRSGNTDVSNGTAVSCTGYPYCYSYSMGQSYYAGCSLSATFFDCTYSSCVACTTDYCNSVTPSSISCFVRTGSGNGTGVTCATGISGCFSKINEAGCGSCSSLDMSCVNCNTSYCNTLTPSAISCYSRSFSLTTFSSNGRIESCYTGLTTCYSYTDQYRTYGGCGRCSTESFGSCVTCSTDNCNTHLPNSISCYYRDGIWDYSYYIPSNGTMTPCSTGVSTCFAYYTSATASSSRQLYSGCGVCSSNASATYGCTTCNTSYCNYAVRQSPNAESTSSPYTISNAVNTQSANAGSTSSPYTISNAVSTQSAKAGSTSSPNTISNAVNTQSANAGGTLSSNSTTKEIDTVTTATKSVRTNGISCYYSFAENQFASRRQVSCYSGSCFQYSFSFGNVNYFFAGCGNCTSYTSYECRTCATELCNSAISMSSGARVTTFAVAVLLVWLKLR